MIQIDEKVLRDSNEIEFETENGDIIIFTKRQKGMWIRKNGLTRCSVCGSPCPSYEETDDYDEVVMGEYETNYCPDCGVRMEGVRENDNTDCC